MDKFFTKKQKRNPGLKSRSVESKLRKKKTKQPVGIVIGTYGSLPYVHLHLAVRKKFFPSVPLLVHDDCSSGKRLQELCKRYKCSFMTNEKRLGHIFGDLSVFADGLRWAELMNIEILIKLSRRWIFRVDYVSDLMKLVKKEKCATYSNRTATCGFGFRTDCIGMEVKRWVPYYSHIWRTINSGSFGYDVVERYFHLLAMAIDPKGFVAWPLMGQDWGTKSDNYLWYRANSIGDYRKFAKSMGVEYKIGW